LSLPFNVVEIGASEEDLKLELIANSAFELPEILIHMLPEGAVHLGASRLHRYLLRNHLNSGRRVAPLAYNTWFDDFEFLKPDRLRKQLKVAKDIGCEVFMVDAGWFGGETGNWYGQTGDWREKHDAAFQGHMQEFAEEVRLAGLGFGLWMEPERISNNAPVYKEHPEWFIPIYNGNFYPDIAKPEVYSYILGEISHLIEKYKLAWIKIDFNSELGVDTSGTELHSYYNSWYCILKELMRKYPDLFIENCASGGLRMNIGDLVFSDGFFISDTVYPYDVLHIYQGALLRLPPGKLIKWAILRSMNSLVPEYGISNAWLETAKESIITPTGATWESFVKTDIDFAIRVALPGMFSLGGDLSEMPQWALERLKYNIAFYKKWREFMLGSIAHLLTPVTPIRDENGWTAIQLQSPEETTSLMFVYRLDDACHTKQFHLRELDSSMQYEVVFENIHGTSPVILYGSQLMNEGISVKIPNRNNSAIIVITPLQRS
jgi:Alpha-galactosidase